MMQRLKWPGLALVLGVLGAALRRRQLATAFEAGTGFLKTGAPATAALTACLVLAAAVGLLLAGTARDRTSREGKMCRWDLVFAGNGDTTYMTLTVLAAFCTLAACPLTFPLALERMAAFKAGQGGDNGILTAVVAVAALPAGWALLTAGQDAFRMRGRGRENPRLLIPGALCCVWVLEAYRVNAADPVLWNYVPLVLAAVFGLLYYMDWAALAFEGGNPRRMLCFALLTVVFSAVAAAGGPDKGTLALLAGQTMAALAALWLVPANLKRPPEAARFAACPAPEKEENDAREENAPAQEIQEEDHHV